MNEEPDPRNQWQRDLPDYRGMGRTLAFVGLGVALAALVVVMMSGSGHDDVRPPEPAKSGVAKPG
jgi:hypothetical protein